MIAALALLAATPAADEITVLAGRAKRIRWHYAITKKGALKTCRITRSSGDGEIDALVCEATRQCAGEGPADRTRINACVTPRAKDLIYALRDRRVAAKQAPTE